MTLQYPINRSVQRLTLYTVTTVFRNCGLPRRVPCRVAWARERSAIEGHLAADYIRIATLVCSGVALIGAGMLMLCI
jgi:hypothetical protein